MANLKKEIETYIKSVDETGRGLEVDVGGNGIETTATRITVKMFPEVSSPGCNVGRGTIKVSIGTGINDYLNCGEPSDCRAGHCTDFNESPDCNIHASNGKIWGTISNGLNTYGAEVHTYLQNFDVDVKRPEDVTVSSLNIEQDEDN
ncbi:MAG: hypothetical protein GY849_22505, partial [Deltaproteobacteria bacterium]|nr:hypothetical protein [Deltaproteobacteria bacterium]